DFVRHLRADPKLASIGIIFYTASYEASEAKRIGRECGVAHVLMKPSEPELILETMEMALGRPARMTPAPTAEESEFERLQSGAMRMGALIDFQLEIATQRRPDQILRILARAAPTVISSAVGVVAVTEDDRTSGYINDHGALSPYRAEWLEARRGAPSLSVPLETATRKYGTLELINRHGTGGRYTADDER